MVFLMSRMVVADEYQRDKECSLSFVDFLEALTRLSDGHASEGVMASTNDNTNEVAESLVKLLDIIFYGIAKFHKGEMRIKAPGSSHDNKKLADMKEYFDTTPKSVPFGQPGSQA